MLLRKTAFQNLSPARRHSGKVSRKLGDVSFERDPRCSETLTIFDFFHPFTDLLQAERCFCIAIVLVWINMKDLFVLKAGTCSSRKARSVRYAHCSKSCKIRMDQSKTHKARREFRRPVPSISTSQVASLKDSILLRKKNNPQDHFDVSAAFNLEVFVEERGQVLSVTLNPKGYRAQPPQIFTIEFLILVLHPSNHICDSALLQRIARERCLSLDVLLVGWQRNIRVLYLLLWNF